MLKILSLLTLFIAANAIAQKQNKDAGYLIYLLGNDTTMAGSYSLNGNDFDITVVARPSVSVTKLKGSLNAKGEIISADGYGYKPVPGKDSQLLITYKLYLRNDSTIIEQKRGNDVSTQRFAGAGLTANGIGVAFRYVLPFWPYYTPKKVGDSLVSAHLTLGTNKRLTVTRTAKDKLYAGSTVMGMVTLYLDKNGRLSSIDGIGSSWNVTGKVTGPIDLDQLANRYALEEQSGGGLKIINRLDSVATNVNGANIKIVYSRPQVRNRTIFGSVVPWNRWWRTGANSATRITIDKPLIFDGKELPAGSYSIVTIPAQNGWTLVFNNRPNVWGTEYDAAYDVLRVPMQMSAADFTETMTISVEPSTDGGKLNVIWENVKASAQFKNK
jgi:hypothetical protein